MLNFLIPSALIIVILSLLLFRFQQVCVAFLIVRRILVRGFSTSRKEKDSEIGV